MKAEKVRVRQEALRRRESLDQETREAKSVRVKETLFSLPEFQRAEVVFFFASFRSEVSTLPQIADALRLGKRIVLPRVDVQLRQLELYEIKDISETSPGCMGILEPTPSEERRREINDVELVVMPGAAFDPRGNRLGYGGGYYDRLLSGLRKKIPLIAIAFDEQIQDSVPSGPHDIRVHTIVTDKRVIRCAES